MIPAVSNILNEKLNIEKQPSKTYKLNIENNTISGGYVDEIEAMKQAIYKILNTERFENLIYSWNYGVELKNLMGEHINYVFPELERVITEALMQDDRIENVTNFSFEVDKNTVNAKFVVITLYGSVNIEKEVNI